MRLQRLRLEFRVELAAKVIRMIRDLADLHISAVGRFAGNLQATSSEHILKFAIELKPMPMPFADCQRSISLLRETARLQHAGPRTQPHRAAQFVDALQFSQLVNHPMRRYRIELGGIGVLQAADIARIFDHHGLHSQTNAEIRHFLDAREFNGVDHPLNAALAKTPRHQDAIVSFEFAFQLALFEMPQPQSSGY